jgi:N-methylhydantoinase B
MAHWLDIGGMLGGMSTDIFAEGLQIPIMKLHDRGVVNETLVDIIRQNVRLPSRAMGDLRAQVTAVKTGERRFLQLIERYGRDAVLGAIAAIMDHAEAMARSRTVTIPDGVYEAESYMDDDGIEGRQAGADPCAHRGEGRRDDGRPHQCVEAGTRLL